VTKRREAERALASEKERLAVTLRSIGEGVITTDTEGKVMSLNRAAEMLTGWSEKEAGGKSIAEVLPLSERKTGERCESTVHKVLRLIADSGAPIRDREGIIIGVVLVFRDITENQQLEEKILKAEKIESLGVLAGGIAHDFNNLLTAILGNVELAAMSLTPDSEALKSLSRAEKAVVRARDLTNQLLTFSKGGAPIKKAASIAEIIRDSADFAVRGSNVGCEFLLPGDLWKVEIDEGQFSQVINNLVINAVQAMPGGGKIRISAGKALISPPGMPSPGKDKYVKITVSDQGPGIPQEHVSRIFDPYFTTKSTGSGLGLATTYSIIKSHGGFVDVFSETGKGTTFHIFLPALDGDERATGERQYRPPAGHGTGRILLMDDDEMVRMTVGNMLKRTGYEVTFASEGSEALRLYRDAMEANNPFLLVIMDLTVPGGMGGSEAMQRLREIDPAVRAIVSSGYSSDPVMANHRRYGFAAVLVKPYRKEQLAAAIQETLASR
jgi:PAS domain S-box-containing protein